MLRNRLANGTVVWLFGLGILVWSSGCASRSSSVKVEQSQEPTMRTPGTEERVAAAP